MEQILASLKEQLDDIQTTQCYNMERDCQSCPCCIKLEHGYYCGISRMLNEVGNMQDNFLTD